MMDIIDKKIEELSKNYNISKSHLKKEIQYDEIKIENNNKIKYKNTLVIEYLKIEGKKKCGTFFEKRFDFDKGVNIISTNGNNFKGKTTLLEIIKFLLTGNDNKVPSFANKSIKKYEILLRINFEKYKFIYNNSIFRIEKIKEEEVEIICEGERKDAETFLSSFFSKQFNYHIFKYAKVGKSSLDLKEVTLNWKSYFGSIYLKDYNYLITENPYGGLKSKIVQLLFNLDYNRFINSLELKLNFSQRELQKYKMLKTQKNYIKESESSLEKKINQLTTDLDNLSLMLEELLEVEKNKIILLKNNKSKLKIDKLDLKNEINELDKEEVILNRKKLLKTESEILKKFLPTDYSCPICEKEFKDEYKIDKISKNICYICGEEHVYQDTGKATDIKEIEKKIDEEISKIKFKKNELEQKLTKIDLEIIDLEEKISIEEVRMQEIEKEIDEMYSSIKNKKIELYDSKAKLEILEEFKKLNKEEDLVKIVDILKELIVSIKDTRYKNAEEKINIFREEFKEESIKIGVRGLDDIKFNEKDFDVVFYKDGEKEGFGKLADGEKLRVKIAFYLTWIQMALKGNESVHPAFLMIDSPGKEETNEYDLEELSKIFYDLDKNNEEFQIIIASAKNLPNATSSKKNKVYTDYLF
ncbi:MAG: hypothetical protein ACRC4T_12250 [Cetobacterium sp.]